MFNNGGVTIASRWPILEEDRRFFGEERCAGLDCFAEKGVVRATVEKGGLRFNIFGTHAQAGTAPAAARVRREQFAMIRDLVASSHIPAREPVLLAGDFNVDALGHQDEHQQMLRVLDAHSALPPGLGGTYDADENPLARGTGTELLDHILWSRAHRCPEVARTEILKIRTEAPWRDGIRDLSDHHALAGQFEFQAEARTPPVPG